MRVDGSRWAIRTFPWKLDRVWSFRTPSRPYPGWDTIKVQFTGTDCEDEFDDVGWALPPPGATDNSLIGLEGNYLQLNKWATHQPQSDIITIQTKAAVLRSQVQGIFDPIVQDVLNLVQGQVRKIKVAVLSLQAILLVGGFGGCEYLFRRLRRAHPKITAMQPPDA